MKGQTTMIIDHIYRPTRKLGDSPCTCGGHVTDHAMVLPVERRSLSVLLQSELDKYEYAIRQIRHKNITSADLDWCNALLADVAKERSSRSGIRPYVIKNAGTFAAPVYVVRFTPADQTICTIHQNVGGIREQLEMAEHICAAMNKAAGYRA